MRMTVPGFVDLQVNGYLGTSFSDKALTRQTFADACKNILDDGGCACILPTVVTSPHETYEHVLPVMADVIENSLDYGIARGRLLGIHMEGPFISPEAGARGCHPLESVLPRAEPSLLQKYQHLARGLVRLITIAAEVEGMEAFCRAAGELGVVVSLGHQVAAAADISRAASAGATLLTHLGNGMPSSIHRHNNPLWSCLADDRLSAMLITDGQHLPPEAIVAFVRAKGLERCIVTSDCAPVAGLPDGEYGALGGRVHVEGEHVRSADRQYLAGSGALMLACVNHLASLPYSLRPGAPPGLEMRDLEEVAFFNPLRALGEDPRAVLAAWAGRPGLLSCGRAGPRSGLRFARAAPGTRRPGSPGRCGRGTPPPSSSARRE